MTAGETAVRPLVGTSACLLGERTRYDGRLKGDAWVQDVLAAHCRLVRICPEVEVGMPVPREPIHLVGPASRPRVVGNDSRRDWTGPLRRLVRQRIAELRRLPLAGFVLKSRSPSCGIGGAELEDRRGRIQPRGTGVLALGLQQTLTWLPLIQETDLADTERRLRFLAQVFVLSRVEEGLGTRPSAGTLRRVHARQRQGLAGSGHRDRSDRRPRSGCPGPARRCGKRSPEQRPGGGLQDRPAQGNRHRRSDGADPVPASGLDLTLLSAV